MSDMMTNSEADEVLASIRRLVAETHGHRPEPVSAPVPFFDGQDETPVKAETDALVLTPNFRVRQSEATQTSPAQEDVAHVPVSEVTPEMSAKPLVLETPSEPLILSPELAVHLPEPNEAGQAEELTLETLVAEEVRTETEAHADAVVANAMKSDWADALDDTPNEDAARHAARLTLEQRIAELEAAVGAQGLDWEPDGSEDLEAEIPREMPRAFSAPGARVLHFRAREAAPRDNDVHDDDARADQAGDKDEVAMSQSEEAKPVSDAIDDAIHDAEVIEEMPASPVEVVAEQHEPEIEEEVEDLGAAAEVAHDPDPSLEEELALAGYADEDIMDEQALRDLVAQVIREELQGELGQRITRNVRRLVRREVQRALTLREFE
ncbi:hypothetical protein [Celeribacter persicus]|uniref:Uncharacterized protein n=1 Tax=Celeribacter persicus TaxID=1651082 RepID=A0A2T5HME2_9RHOB|nr:hypothetical protein [Celeribacter persicus]PTQ72724.1 hypothetical protein C8N42_106235 [Celeribacter persicus]